MTTTRIVTAPNVQPVFQVATGDVDSPTGTGVYDESLYDDPGAVYTGLDADWSDEGCDVIEAVTWLGRQRSADVFDVGVATVTVRNDDGRWDYPPPDPPPTPLTLRPGRQCRFGVLVDGTEMIVLWHGWIDRMTPEYLPDHRRDTVTIDAVCAKGEFGRVTAPAVTAPVGAGETVTARMTRYADVAAFPAHRRQFAESAVTLNATSLGGRVGELADRSATSAGGDVFGDQKGMLRFEPADWRVRLAEPVDGYIGNRNVPGPDNYLTIETGVDLLLLESGEQLYTEEVSPSPEVCPNAWEIMFARSDFTNRVNYGAAGGAVTTINDPVNQVRYGVETWDVTNLETQDAALRTRLGERALEIRNFDLAPRVAAVTLNAATRGAAQLMATADPFRPSMYNCGLIQDGRTVFARSLYVTGIEHTITGGQWTARLALDDATPWIEPADTRYDDADYDVDVYTNDPT